MITNGNNNSTPQASAQESPGSTHSNGVADVKLKRVLGLSLLVFYGVGVTIGAGIFALIGEVVKVAGDLAPAAFLLAGIIAGATALSYAQLSSVYPRAGGEAIYVTSALGRFFGMAVGYGVTITAIVSSAVIIIAFSGYLGTLLPVSQPLLIISFLLVMAIVASIGVKESVLFAAVITLLEVGTLSVVIFYGADHLADKTTYVKALAVPQDIVTWSVLLSASIVSFFAFIGFEDLVNMAEEAVNPTQTMPRAIIITLAVTIILYVLIALIAIAIPDRESLINSSAPLATIFESVTGLSGKPVSAMASIAMVNGVLVQIVMASRVIYGMTSEGLAPKALGVLNHSRQTPVRAIILVTLAIAVLALALPLLRLAQTTSLVTLSVFTLVNIALWRIGSRAQAHPQLIRWRYWGIVGAVLTGGLLVSEIIRLI